MDMLYPMILRHLYGQIQKGRNSLKQLDIVLNCVGQPCTPHKSDGHTQEPVVDLNGIDFPYLELDEGFKFIVVVRHVSRLFKILDNSDQLFLKPSVNLEY